MSGQDMRKLMENISPIENSIQEDFDATLQKAHSLVEHLLGIIQMHRDEIASGEAYSVQVVTAYDALDIMTSIKSLAAVDETIDSMADEDDFGVQDDIGRTAPSDMLPTNVSYSIKFMPGDEDYDEPDEYMIWRQEGGSSSALGQNVVSMEQAETIIANDAKNTGVGRNYEINYR